MRRGLVSSAVVSALLLTAAAPFGGAANAAACPSWTDAPGDANVQGRAEAKDDSVDITAVKIEQSTEELRATFTVPKLGNVNEWLPGDRFEIFMKASGTDVTMASDRDDVNQGRRVGVVVGNTFTSGGQAVYDVAGHQVVLTVPYATFDKALGKAFKGLALTAIVANVRGSFSPVSMSTLDTAPAPASLSLVAGRVCGDGQWGAATILPIGPAGAITAERPAAGCFGVTDDKGDARLPNVNSNVPTNDADLDIVGVTMRTTDRMLLAYLKIDALAAGGPKNADGHRFSIDFAFNNHLFTVAASQFKNANSPSIREGLAAQGLAGRMVQMSLDTPSGTDVAYARAATVAPTFVQSDSKAFFDVPNSTVVIGIPIADIQKYGRTRFHGAEVTSIVARATGDFYRNSLIADTAPAASATQYSWVAGQNKCFSLPTKLALTSVKAPAARTVLAKVTTSTGEAVVAQPVTFLVKGKKSVVQTGADGVAALKGVKPGSKVTATLVPSTGYRPSTATTKV